MGTTLRAIYFGSALLAAPLAIAYLFVIARIFSRLENAHPTTFAALGSPSLFFNNTIRNGISVTRFLLKREYGSLSDPGLARLGALARLQYIVVMALFITSLGALAIHWFSYGAQISPWLNRLRASLVWVVAVVVCIAVPLSIWRRWRWLRIVLAASFFLLQFAMLLRMDQLGRPAVARVIDTGGPVREVSETLLWLKDAQLPAAIALLISGVGLLLLAAFHRNGSVRTPGEGP